MARRHWRLAHGIMFWNRQRNPGTNKGAFGWSGFIKFITLGLLR